MNYSDIFRTHLMRPTWHFVSANDILQPTFFSPPDQKTKSKTEKAFASLAQFLDKKNVIF
jgi:hypothetical protein